MVNPQKSNLVPSQVVQYLGVVIDSTSFRASPSQERISRLQSTAAEFQSPASPPASLWLSLLGVLSSLAHLVPGGRQDAVPPALPPSILGSSGSRGSSVCDCGVSPRPPVVAPPPSSVSRSVSLPGVSRPTLLVRCPSRPSDRFRPVGLAPGGVVHQRQGTARCETGSSPVPVLSTGSHGGCLLRQRWLIFARRVAQDLLSSTPWLRGSCAGRSPSPSAWLRSSSRAPTTSSQTPSRPHQLPHSEWSLNLTVFQSLSRLWPVQIDLFATSENHRCSIYFSPFWDPMSAGTDAFLQSWDGLQACAFPPVAIIPLVLAKLRASTGMELTLVAPHWAQRPWFSDLLQLSLAPPVILPDRQDLLRLPRSRHLYPDLRRLRLHAWRLSSDLPEPLASTPLQRSSLRWRAVHPRARYIR